MNPSIKHQKELTFLKAILTDSWLSLQDKIQSKCHKYRKIQSKSLQWDSRTQQRARLDGRCRTSRAAAGQGVCAAASLIGQRWRPDFLCWQIHINTMQLTFKLLEITQFNWKEGNTFLDLYSIRDNVCHFH